MATTQTMSNMLNENIYRGIQQAREQSTELVSERERIRNEFIDKMGRKPSEEEIDAILAGQLTSGAAV